MADVRVIKVFFIPRGQAGFLLDSESLQFYEAVPEFRISAGDWLFKINGEDVRKLEPQELQKQLSKTLSDKKTVASLTFVKGNQELRSSNGDLVSFSSNHFSVSMIWPKCTCVVTLLSVEQLLINKLFAIILSNNRHNQFF